MFTDHEQKILSYLRSNARASIAQIAMDMQIPVSTVFSSLKQLEEKRIIVKYTSLIDYTLLNLVHVNLVITVKQKKELLRHVQQSEQVNSISLIRNDGILVDALFPDIAHLYAFIESLQEYGPLSIEAHHIIEELKREAMFEA